MNGFVELVADTETFEAWDDDVVSGDPLGFVDTRPYPERLSAARCSSGSSEAVITGLARIAGHPVGLVVCDFGFIGGSMGVASGERVARAFERAGEERIPVLAVVASGGVRMQEGVPAFMQMVKTSSAAWRYRRAGGRYLVYLAGPACGGVLASWAALGQFTLAAPGAFVSLSGTRVAAATETLRISDVVRRSEMLRERGLIDELVAPERLRERTAEILDVLDSRTRLDGRPPPRSPVLAGRALLNLNPDAWSVVVRSRDPRRPGVRELLEKFGRWVVQLGGEGAGSGHDPACDAGLLRFNGVDVVAIAQTRDGQRPASMGPSGYRMARRAMNLAEELTLPLITFIDTPGADGSDAAEEDGLAFSIGGCLATMTSLEVPTVSVLLGQGGGGGAIALLPADRVVAAEQAWLAPLPPEGVSALLFRSSDHAGEMASAQRITAPQLAEQGIVDVVVPEVPDAAAEPETFIERLGNEVTHQLAAVLAERRHVRDRSRRMRYRHVGAPRSPVRISNGGLPSGGSGYGPSESDTARGQRWAPVLCEEEAGWRDDR